VLEKVKAMIEDISLNGKYHTILIESAILFQVEELKNLCSEIWYIESNTQNRRERLKRERNYSDERIQMMMESQECIHLCREKCDKVIINDKGQDTLEEILAKL
jgi:dephospho-CoA kinase